MQIIKNKFFSQQGGIQWIMQNVLSMKKNVFPLQEFEQFVIIQ